LGINNLGCIYEVTNRETPCKFFYQLKSYTCTLILYRLHINLPVIFNHHKHYTHNGTCLMQHEQMAIELKCYIFNISLWLQASQTFYTKSLNMAS
jgi:hypothetical protein